MCQTFDKQEKTATWQLLSAPLYKHPLSCLLQTHSNKASLLNYPGWAAFTGKEVARLAMAEDLEIVKNLKKKCKARHGSIFLNVQITLSRVLSVGDEAEVVPREWPQSKDACSLAKWLAGGQERGIDWCSRRW